jgi:hypothetical protein
MTVAGEQTGRINTNIDSLKNLSLPAKGLLGKLDSTNRWKDNKIDAPNKKVEKLKAP